MIPRNFKQPVTVSIHQLLLLLLDAFAARFYHCYKLSSKTFRIRQGGPSPKDRQTSKQNIGAKPGGDSAKGSIYAS